MFNVIMKAGAYPDPHSYLFAHYSMQLNNYQVLHVGSQQSIFMWWYLVTGHIGMQSKRADYVIEPSCVDGDLRRGEESADVIRGKRAGAGSWPCLIMTRTRKTVVSQNFQIQPCLMFP